MSKTEAQTIIYHLSNCEYEKVEQQIDCLKTHPNNLIIDFECRNYWLNGHSYYFQYNSPIFTEIAKYMTYLRFDTNYDKSYNCLKRCLQKLKDKGADLEKRQANSLEHTTVLRLLFDSSIGCAVDLFEFLLKLGCQINNQEINWLMERLIIYPNDEYFKVALKYGLKPYGKIWVGHNIPHISVKKRFDAVWAEKIERYITDPNKDASYYRETIKALRMKEFIDTGKANEIWAEIKKEEEDKARKESERLAKIKAEKDRIEAERLAKIKAEKDRIEAERLAKIRAEKSRLAEIKRKEEAEKQRLLEIQRKKNEDDAYIQTIIDYSEECKKVIQYLKDDFVEHNIVFINKLLSMLNNPEHINKTKVLDNIKYIQDNKNRDPELGLDEKSKDEMGGAFFLLGIANCKSMIKYKEQFSSQFSNYITQYNEKLFRLADEHIHPEHKKKILNSF